jgi:general secretion pathway protein B
MSYILDALRRADSERDRDRSGTPSLHSQMHDSVAPVDATDETEELRSASWPWSKLLLGLGVGLLLGATVWWWMGGWPAATSSELQAAAPIAVAPQPVTSAPVAAPGAAPVSAMAGSASLPNSSPELAPMPRVLPERERKLEKKAEKKPEKSKPERAERKPPAAAPIEARGVGAAESSERAPPLQPALKRTNSAAETSRVKPLAEMPEALRRELPPLVVSGSMYSPEPASRMLVIDGQVLREGQQVRQGLTVERIGPKAATLSLRGERFELSY